MKLYRDIDLFEEKIMNRPAAPVITVILVLIVTACSGMPDSRFRELRLEYHATRFTAEEEALEIYALGLHRYVVRYDDPGFEADDMAEVWLELIRARGALEDMEGAEIAHQVVTELFPGDPLLESAHLELAESLGITFMGLYVHEPKGILIDSNGRFAVLPGREGAIDIGLRTLLGPLHAVTPEVITHGNPVGESVRKLKKRFMQSLLQARDDLGRDYLNRLMRLLRRSRGSPEMERIGLEIMRIAKEVDDLDAARRAWTIFTRHSADDETSRAVEFAYARTMLTGGDAGESKRLVYGAVGDRREREDLYLLLELAAALSILNDVDGARAAYEKVIEITGGAGEAVWRSYIEALNRVGRELDHFSCEGLDGGVIDTRDYRGDLLLIDFWGSWCHACIREMPHVFEAYNRYRDDGFSVLGVVVRDTKEKARAFLRRTGYPWDQVFDEESSIAETQVVVGYPTTILVDREGKVRCTRTFGGGLEIALRLLVNRDLPPLPD